jgi:hypothetical protein
MASGNISSATYTNLEGVVPDFLVNAVSLDSPTQETEETYWYFSEAVEMWGYYLSIPEINSAANSLATWAVGKGYEVREGDEFLKQDLQFIRGSGADTFQTIMWNHLVTKVIVGDAFCKIIRKEGRVVNLLPISPERVRIVYKGSLIKRYDVWDGKEWKPVNTEDMLHSINNRVGDNMHGTSQIKPNKWIIDARNEALIDDRKIAHRSLALGIAYYKTNNEGKITYVNNQIEQAVKRGEMLGVPEDTVKFEDFPNKSLQERLPRIQYLENFFYQTFGVPRSIATSDGTSEVGGKMGHVIFEPVYTRHQAELEAVLKSKAQIDIKFNRPPSLGGLMQETEQKNTGQLNIQQNDVSADLQRE